MKIHSPEDQYESELGSCRFPKFPATPQTTSVHQSGIYTLQQFHDMPRHIIPGGSDRFRFSDQYTPTGRLKRNPGDLNPHYAPRLLARYYTDLVFAVGRQRRIASDKPRLLGVGGRSRERGGGGKKLQSRPERNQKEQMAVRLLKNYFPRRRALSPRERLATNFPRSPVILRQPAVVIGCLDFAGLRRLNPTLGSARLTVNR